MLSDLAIYVEDLVKSMGVWSPIVSSLLILCESMLPILPLFVFITINFMAFGHFGGFIISWIFTCLGCFLSYYLVYKNLGNWFSKKQKNLKIINDMVVYVKKLEIPTLSALISCPFTPAFAINIAAGLCRIEFKKFAVSILVGKIFMVYFWGFIGLGLIESFKNPVVLVKVLIMILLAYLASVIINKIIKDKIK